MASETTPLDSPTESKPTFVKHYGSTMLVQGLTLGLGILTASLVREDAGACWTRRICRHHYMAVVDLILSVGINQAIVFHLGRRTYGVSELATAATTIGLVQSLLSIAVGLLVIPLVLAKYPTNVPHLGIMFLLSTPALILGVYTGNLFQGKQDLVRFNFIRILVPLTYFAGLIGISFAHRADLTHVIYSQVTAYVIALVVGSTMVWRKLKP